MKMKSLSLVALICILEFCFGSFNDGQTFFRHRVASVERRSPGGNSNGLEEMTRRWLKRYYHNANNPMEQNSPTYDINTPDDFRWLIENAGNLDQSVIRYPGEGMKPEDEGSDFEGLYEDTGNNDVDPNDIYNLASLLNGRISLEPPFEQALREYLIQENAHDEPKNEANQHDTDQKKSTHQPTETTSTEPSMAKTTPTSAESLSKTTHIPLTPTTSSNSLSVMPPVHVGKGQKEYPMLRPASENGRKFDGWPESLQETIMNSGNNIGLPRFLIKKDFPRDVVREELDKLKMRTRRSLKEPFPVFF